MILLECMQSVTHSITISSAFTRDATTVDPNHSIALLTFTSYFAFSIDVMTGESEDGPLSRA